ncbi:MAG TPA: tetratricopeptide repeat protein [Polyangiaceae bacterium]|nr:tetratricopeptide repeat protein [Polyangiaceae bacterium]
MKTAVWLALALLSCSAAKQAPYDQAAHSAERAYSAGRYQEAARHWLEAAQHSEEARDRDEAEYRAAASYERGEQYEQALAIYKRIVKQNGERAARAAVATAEVERRRGSEERAQELFLAAMRAYPNSAPAEQALREHLAFVKRGGVQAALSALGPLIEEFSNSDLDERLRYERARLLDETNRTEAARDAYLETARRHPYPEGALWDDALFRAAECEDKLGHPRQAITLLESMLAEREEAHVSGSYERPRYAQGRFKIAELYRDKLADPARARAEFRRVWNEHPTTLLRDDALFEEALIAHKEGDRAGTCQALGLLIEDATDSRFAPCAPRLCPSLKAPDERPCRDYLRLRIERGAER